MTGLRVRLVALLAVVCAGALGICALTLLPPLEQRLRNDQVNALVRRAREAMPAIVRDAGTPPHPSRALTGEARALRHRDGAEVAFVGAGGRLLALSDPDERLSTYPEALSALRTGRVVRTTAGSGRELEAQVAVPTNDGFAIALRKPLSGATGAARVVRHAFVIAAVVSLVIAVVLGSLLAGRVVRRLRGLRDSALTVAELGPTAEFRADGARDEVGDLSRAFAVMQEHLREQESARRSFVATASHELRTPLTSLRVMLDTLRGDLEGPEPDVGAALAQVAEAEAQADRLSALTADLLDLSRLDAGVPLRSELLEIGELARSVVAELDVRAHELNRDIVLDAPRPQWAVGDPGSTAQVLRILLDNALRHGGGDVTVSVDSVDGMARVAVCDDGAGVPDEERDRIFRRFERGTATAPGFGLGLAIGSELAQLMHGALTLVSSTNGGARFELELPGGAAP